MPFSAVPLDDVGADEIVQLCDEGTPEGDTLEFKEAPASSGPDHAWADRQDLTNRARNWILREVVGFTNAHGGRVVIGIRESDDEPSRAQSVAPVAEPHQLAEKLRFGARDCIEPQIPFLRAIGIDVRSGGGGFVVIDVPAPHMFPSALRFP